MKRKVKTTADDRTESLVQTLIRTRTFRLAAELLDDLHAGLKPEQPGDIEYADRLNSAASTLRFMAKVMQDVEVDKLGTVVSPEEWKIMEQVDSRRESAKELAHWSKCSLEAEESYAAEHPDYEVCGGCKQALEDSRKWLEGQAEEHRASLLDVPSEKPGENAAAAHG